MENKEETITYPIVVQKSKWENFKSTISRTEDITAILIEMIDQRIELFNSDCKDDKK